MTALPVNGKVLITGASGFIGSRLRATLLDAGVDVVSLRRPGSPPAKAGRSVQAGYDDAPALERILGEEKPDYLLHVAGVTKGVRYEDFRRGNVMPTRNLLAATKRAHPALKRFVHISSLAAYGPSRPERPLREDAPRRPGGALRPQQARSRGGRRVLRGRGLGDHHPPERRLRPR